MQLQVASVVFAVVVLGALCRLSFATNVIYSWSGSIGRIISLTEGNNTDPWMIEDEDLPFVLQFEVSSSEVDIFDRSVNLAGYSVGETTLILNGESVHYVGSGVLSIDDGIGLLAPLADIVVFTGEFQRHGETLELSFVAAVDTTTFQFSNLVEELPAFNSTKTTFKSGSGGDGPYSVFVDTGTPIIVSPEPRGLVLLISVVFSGLLWTRNFR